ncbi:cysteine desulfurase family protein [Microbacterium sp.]|uniref:cysteine desulfurase family protein n=1 Tax=Microbacterium sp. TaxID=51671 RepID=UPI0039E29154
MPVYLDHAATTPLRPEAREAWLEAVDAVGNAASVHGHGQAARRLWETARESVAASLDCDPIEVLFTSGGTESINLAVKGLWWSREPGRSAIVMPEGEHHATTEAVDWLRQTERAEVRAVPLTPHGAPDTSAFAAAVPGAAVATALVANNEVGTVTDVPALVGAAGAAGVPLHLDAVGAVGALEVSFRRWRGPSRARTGLVALSMSGHKVGGPTGIGALVVSRYASLTPLIHGGGQQRSLRPGTADVAGAVAMAAALAATAGEREAESGRLAGLRDHLMARIDAELPEAEILGDRVERLPGNVHVRFPGADGETLLFLLDQQQISVSTGAACQAGITEPSHVVLALGRDERAARSVLRITLGRTTTRADVDALADVLPTAYGRARAAAGGSG